MGNFFILKYCHFSRSRVFCSIRHTLSKGQIKLWGHRVSFFFVIRQACLSKNREFKHIQLILVLFGNEKNAKQRKNTNRCVKRASS